MLATGAIMYISDSP